MIDFGLGLCYGDGGQYGVEYFRRFRKIATVYAIRDSWPLMGKRRNVSFHAAGRIDGA